MLGLHRAEQSALFECFQKCKRLHATVADENAFIKKVIKTVDFCFIFWYNIYVRWLGHNARLFE